MMVERQKLSLVSVRHRGGFEQETCKFTIFIKEPLKTHTEKTNHRIDMSEK